MISETEPQRLAQRFAFFKNKGEPLSEFWGIARESLEFFRLALVAVANFLLVEEWAVNGLLILMLIDTVAGSAKAIYLKMGFTFKLLFWGLITKIGILIIPITLAVLGKGLSLDFKWFVILVMDILLISEAFSIVTNCLSMKQKKQIQNVDFVAILLKTIRTGLLNIGTRMIKKIESGKDPN